GQLAADGIPGVTPENPLAAYGQEVIEANPTVVNKLSDIPKNPLTTVTEATGNAVPSIAGVVGIRALGQGITALSPLTGPAAPVVAGLGQAVSWLGPAAIAALPSYGSIRERQILDEPESQASAKDKAIAAIGAGTVGLIEQRFGPQNWALAAMTKEGRTALAKKFATTTLPGAVGKGVVTGAAVEGGEELVQNPVEQIASYQNPLDRKNLEDTAFGGVMGAVGGGVLGGGFGAASYQSPSARDTVQQRTLSNLIKGAQVSVTGGTATIVEEGKPPVTMQVRDLAEHLAAGGTMDTLTPEQRFGKDVAEKTQFLGSQPAVVGRPETAVGDVQADIFGREALAYNQERNRPRGLVTGEGQGIRSRVPGRTAEEVAAEEAAYQNQPINVPPGAEQGLRAIASGATTVPAFQRDADVVTAPMAAQTDIYNKDRNRPRGLVTPAKSEQQPAVSRVPGVSAEEVLAAEQAYRAYQTGQEPAQAPKPITRSDGKPFSTERTAGVAMKRLGLKAEEVEVRPVAGGFVVVAKTSDSVDKTSGTQYSTSEGSYNSRPVRNYDAGRDVSAEAKEAITVLNQALNVGRTGAQAGSTITPRRVVSTVQSTANRIAAAFGRRVVFFASSDPAAVLPNGFIDKADPRTIYINTESGFSPVTVIGHEILHALRTEREELYNQILEAARGNFKEDMRAQYKARLAKSKYHETRAITEDYLNEEMIADYLGDSFSDPKFWEALAKRKPSVFEQMSYYVVNFLNRLIDHFAGQQKNFQSDLFFKDLVKMRKAVLDAAEQYGGAESWSGMGVPEFRFSRAEIVAHAKAFYSKLQQVASAAFQGMKAQSVLNFLQKQGVKKQEIEAVGVAEWLAGKKPTDKVTQQELLDFVRANTVELEDVVLGDFVDYPVWIVEKPNGERAGFEERAQAEDYARAVGIDITPESVFQDTASSETATHFQQYTEPGAEEGSYREMFVTAPGLKEERVLTVSTKDGTTQRFSNLTEAKRFAKENNIHRIGNIRVVNKWQDGHSQYSDIKNPVVRIRFNTVTTADGKKILR
ncbi:MAG: hypothetical protein WC279_14610, partial [Sulfurimonas sp.]|uniref:hypothetical protein n=1 Tax=Sulfurimonas sp. TaxID=2022749 RepID=UPI003565828E